MRYLLDVNALISLGISGHIFHTRVATWVGSLKAVRSAELTTTPITELGFVRILSQPTPYGLSVSDAKDLLKRVKVTSPIGVAFIVDANDISKLPAWVKLSKQTTDGHLARLAKSNGAVLATLDNHISDSFLIPV
jgi:predicted nucleic acid-binding protein